MVTREEGRKLMLTMLKALSKKLKTKENALQEFIDKMPDKDDTINIKPQQLLEIYQLLYFLIEYNLISDGDNGIMK